MTVSHKSHAVFEKLCPWHYHESCIMKMRSCYIVIYLKLFMNQWHGGKWKSPQKQNLAMLYLVMPKVHTTFKVFKANVSSLSCTSTDPANFVSSHRTCLCWCSGMWLSSVHVSSWYYILIAKADVIKLILKHGNVKWSMKFKTRRKQTLGHQSV